MANTIIYSTPQDQIAKLKKQNLLIENDRYAEDRLKIFGYTNLIRGYRDPYTITVNGKLQYRSDITFDQIVSLYMLDKNLRNAVMAAMLDLEEHVKESVADVIAQSFGVDHNTYLNFRNYQNKHKHNPKFSLKNVLGDIRKSLNTSKDPIHYYMNKYGIVPPWILFKVQFMGTIVNLVNLMKVSEKEQLFKKLYPSLSRTGTIASDKLHLMVDTLFICYEYRNIAAHGGRIFNHICNAQVRPVNNLKLNKPGFGQFIQLLDLLDYKGPCNHLKNVLEREVNRHCAIYPLDVTYLSSILNINIQAHKIAWITKGSKKYHNNPYCSGILNPIEADPDELDKLGYAPCKRCFK